jgi:hypothetical protein
VLLGAEFPPPPYRTSDAGWQAFTELLDKQARAGVSRAVAKFRLGAAAEDVQQVRNLGAQVLWRPRQESPSPGQLDNQLISNRSVMLEGDWLELENEPNHTNSRWVQEGMTQGYAYNLSLLVDVARRWPVKVVSPGLMPESSPTSRSNTVRWIAMSAEQRMRCDLQGGHVYHTNGLDGIMYLPKAGEVVTEFGYSGEQAHQAVTLNNRVLRSVMDLDVAAVVFFILPYSEGEAEWGQYFLTPNAARSYREEHERWHALNDKEEDVSDQERAELRRLILQVQVELGQHEMSGNAEGLAGDLGEMIRKAFGAAGDAVNYLDNIPKV